MEEPPTRADPMDLLLEAALRPKDPRRLPHLVARGLALAWSASHRGFVYAAALQLVGAVSVSALVVVGKFALDGILAAQDGSAAVSALLPVVALLALVTSLGTAATVLQQQQQRLLGEQVAVASWQRVLDVTGRVGLELYESSRFYDHLQRVKTNAVTQPLTVTTAVFGIIGGALGTLGLLAVLVAVEPLLVPVLLLAGVPTLLLSRAASRTEYSFWVAQATTYRLRDYLRQVLTGRDEAKEVRAFGAAPALRERHDSQSDEYIRALREQVRRRQLFAMGVVVTTSLALGGTLALLVWFVSTGRVGVAEAGAAVLGVRLLSGRLDQLFRSVGGLFESAVFLQDLERFLSLASAGESVGTGRPPAYRTSVETHGVGYTYPGSSAPVLHDVDLEIGAGEIVALVGENGSGKTTLAKLVAGLLPPTTGTITWDGVDTAVLDPADVRRSVAVIFQDFVRYRLSALENIGLGEPASVGDLEAARAAAVRAGAADFLERLPQQYDTILSKEYAGGRELSLGQWQRVALARALRRDAPLVILDEPSAALDPRAEQELFADVRALLEDRSALLISHRYSSVRSADRIYVLREGRVAESGSHDQLMALDGLYAELFTLQARAYLSPASNAGRPIASSSSGASRGENGGPHGRSAV